MNKFIIEKIDFVPLNNLKTEFLRRLPLCGIKEETINLK